MKEQVEGEEEGEERESKGRGGTATISVFSQECPLHSPSLDFYFVRVCIQKRHQSPLREEEEEDKKHV